MDRLFEKNAPSHRPWLRTGRRLDAESLSAVLEIRTQCSDICREVVVTFTVIVALKVALAEYRWQKTCFSYIDYMRSTVLVSSARELEIWKNPCCPHGVILVCCAFVYSFNVFPSKRIDTPLHLINIWGSKVLISTEAVRPEI